MTSSLVGSEMCIRDSRCLRGQGSSFCLASSGTAPRIPQIQSNAEQTVKTPCLAVLFYGVVF
eukprot:9274903-Prorocentrum_lima.AAC.1